MARETYTTLTNTTKDYISASSGSLSGGTTIANFVALEVNKAIRNIKSQLQAYITFADDYSFTTVASTQAYDLPANFNRFVAATLSVGSVAYPLREIQSKLQWNKINEIDFSGTTIPQFIFVDHKSFSIYPTPAAAYTGSLTYIPIEKDLDTADYTTGTITLTNGDETVAGAGTTFTADMVGRWLKGTTDGNWYKIATFTNATSLELDYTFQGTTGATLAYTIGESPNIPVELHELIPHRAAAQWYSGPRKDFSSAQGHLNFYRYGTFVPTANDIRMPQGGIEGAKRRYARRGTSHMIYRNKSRVSRFDDRFSLTLSSTI